MQIGKIMSKQHLVESFSISAADRATYHELTNNVPASIKESFNKLKESTRLSESAKKPSNDDIELVKKALSEQKISSDKIDSVVRSLREAGISSSPRLWEFPVSKINDIDHPNLNGRVYNKKLWENVINLQEDTWKGLAGLIDHPADDSYGSFGDQGIVWLGARIDEDTNLVYGIGTFVGKGHLAEEIIDVGGRVGFSSSGYGDFLSDGITVDPDTYEIERLADLVLCPSQGVYGTESNAIDNTIDRDSEVTDDYSLYESKIKNKKEDANMKKDNKPANQAVMAKMVEAYFDKALADAKAIKERDQRIAALTSLIEEIDQDETASEEKKNEVKADAQQCLDGDVAKADSAIENSEEVENETGASNMEEALAKIKEMKARLEAYEKKNKDLEGVQQTLKETAKSLDKAKAEATGLRANMKSLAEDSDKRISSLQRVSTRKTERYAKQLSESQAEIDALNKIKAQFRQRNEELNEENDALVARYNKLLTAYNAMKEDFKREKAKNARLSEAYKKYTVLKEDVEKAAKEDAQIRNYYAKKTTSTNRIAAARPRELTESEEVRLYYKDLKEQYGDAVRPFAREILAARTIKEAQSTFVKHLDEITNGDFEAADNAYINSTNEALDEILGD